MLKIFLNGLLTGAGLIIAIGAQNAYVLGQGIRREYTLMIPFICALCDAVLIMAGVLGLGSLIQSSPLLLTIATLGGTAFLTLYGIRSIISAVKGQETLEQGEGRTQPRARIIMTTLGLTLLNPHVYLDTVILLGSVSAGYGKPGSMFFGAGAVTASFLWFFSLSLGASRLAPFFHKKITWRIMDTVIGFIMFFIAAKLFLPFIKTV
jgi:L-lysine exporter family protein LysE/ArgO